MKTQFLTNTGYGIAMLLSSLTIYPTYAVSKDSLFHLDYQKRTISGTVSDNSGVLIGAIVQIKGTDVATTTDSSGKYSLNASSGDILVISYIGYKTKEIVVTASLIYNISLLQDEDVLSEVVINAGYYSVKDREKTGSIARVTAKDIELQPVINPLQAIQGRMAGVNITQNTGVPGGGFDIQIRGRNSLRPYQNNAINGNAPLYVIDGVVIPNSNLINSPLSTSILPMSDTNILNSINPSDIESIEILKDADATAIYGSRGANGVVLITTKKNKSDKLSFSLSSSTSFSKVASKMKLLNTQQFNKMRDEAFENDGITTYPASALDMNGTWDRNRYTDWQKELIGGTALSQNIQLGVSGGSETTHFSVSASQGTQATVFPTDKGYKRNTFLINFNHNSKDGRFQLNSSTNYSLQKNNLIANDLTNTSLTLSPNAPNLYNPDRSLNWNFLDDSNPISSMYETYENDNNNMNLNLNLNYELFKNIYLKLNAGYNKTNTDEKRLTPHTVYNPINNFTSEQSKLANNLINNNSYILEPQLNYVLNLDKLSVNSLIGLTYQESRTNALYLNGIGFQTNDFISNISAAKTITLSQSANLQYKYAAIFGRLNLTYNNKYLLNITARRDGSSRFGDNHKFGNFAAIGTAWIFSKEDFFKDSSWLSFGKLRASYGTSGSDNIGDYQYLDTYSLNPSKYDELTGLRPSRLHNPNFSWEKTKKLEAAIELALFNDRFQFELAYYRNTSSNQLVGIPLPGTTGFSSIQDNLPATVENKGWEFSINSQNIRTKDFSWSTNFNISFPKNTLLSFPNLDSSTYANRFIIGKSTSVSRLYNFEGIDPLTGLYKFTDYNNDGKITALEDKQNLQERATKYHGGLHNTLTYKNLSLDFLFQFVKQTNYNYNYILSSPGSIFNQPIEILDSWSPTNPNSQYGYFSSGHDPLMIDNLNLFKNSNKIIGDASYIRLKNVSLSYLLKLPKAKIDSVRFYFQGQNLWTITNYFGLDPEFTALGFLPPLKTFAFGVQLTF
ncbi:MULTISPECIES: SusC/RagA family TonB-linked outer membrane protein [Myroides]|uniref:SusC/RagA family TonB-linked outer membrane protein n=1 Tax=Myroides TaxID=76831 RepID=UPI00257881C1|nr:MULTISPECIES: SusC/RagA family TonB-linked outer membrane protein [Myroides]MDM1377703.1 SusC/RagA family TonB-linked outer membrane protein [Myroides marinus]MDM1385093.1 SusC/RagA family TonB-linked outer membrane protein [Myroides marinus]MDM1392187.1 SusC/RagA family TonB-linked outer membrane protein [Myroides marinus]MEC4028524.1 SusC/RagA family TonB-linked outer membrane protein [Myroides odoratimimus]